MHQLWRPKKCEKLDLVTYASMHHVKLHTHNFSSRTDVLYCQEMIFVTMLRWTKHRGTQLKRQDSSLIMNVYQLLKIL